MLAPDGGAQTSCLLVSSVARRTWTSWVSAKACSERSPSPPPEEGQVSQPEGESAHTIFGEKACVRSLSLSHTPSTDSCLHHHRFQRANSAFGRVKNPGPRSSLRSTVPGNITGVAALHEQESVFRWKEMKCSQNRSSLGGLLDPQRAAAMLKLAFASRSFILHETHGRSGGGGKPRRPPFTVRR